MTTLKSTYERANEMNSPASVKSQVNFFEENDELQATILEFVRDCSSSFCSDICSKMIANQWNLSEKQAWCVGYEFIKIKHQLPAWSEKQMKDLGWSESDMNTVLSNLK